MKIKVNKEELKEAVVKVSRILKGNVNKRMLLDVNKEELTFTGVSHELGLRTRVEDFVTDESFKCLFEAELFLSIISKMSGPSVVLELKKDTLYIKSEIGTCKIKCVDVAEFYGWNPLIDVEFEVETNELFSYVSSSKHALPSRSSNTVMECFCIQYGNGCWQIVATDGARISRRGEVEAPEKEFLINGVTMTTLETIFGNKSVKLLMKGDQIQICDELNVVSLRTVAGNFFQINNLFHLPYQNKIVLNRQALEDALSLVNVVHGQKTGEITINKEGMVIEAEDIVGNELKSNVPYESDQDIDCKLGINIKYLLDAVKSLEDENVSIEVHSVKHPIRIMGENYCEIVLPVMLR